MTSFDNQNKPLLAVSETMVSPLFQMAKLCFVEMAANGEESIPRTMIRWVASGEGPHGLH